MESSRDLDFEIVWKKINGTLTTSEEELFNDWIKDDEHRRYFEKASRYFIKGSHFDIYPLDLHTEWQKIENNFESHNIKKGFSVRRMVIIAATVSLLIISFFLFDSFNSNEKTILNEVALVNPAIEHSKAILTIENGARYELSEDESLTIESDNGTRIASGGSSISYIQEVEKQVRDPKKIEYNTLEIPRGGEFFVELSDGTKIWINAKSTLRFPVQFIGNERNVELVGEAYFEVAHDPSKPFHVISGVQKIEVLGTSFAVRSYEDDDDIITTLVEGRVSVENIFDDHHKTHLIPNQQSIMSKSTGDIVSKEVNTNQFIAWKSGRFYFESESLPNIMKVLSRWYDIDVFFDNSKSSEIQFTGGFERYEKFEQVKSLMERTEEVQFIIKKNTVIIK